MKVRIEQVHKGDYYLSIEADGMVTAGAAPYTEKGHYVQVTFFDQTIESIQQAVSDLLMALNRITAQQIQSKEVNQCQPDP
jgi:hypothetical protein